MYGLVNQAIKDLVVTSFGENEWVKICELSKIDTTDFVSMQYYPDELTYGLVGSASKVLMLEPSKILNEFGKYFILYTDKAGYGALMNLFGQDFKSCLQNLNNLHSRMGMTMPQLSPPKFSFKEIDNSYYQVEYFSKRAGLCPMVIGLLEGLAKKYNVNAEIKFEEIDSTKMFHIKILE